MVAALMLVVGFRSLMVVEVQSEDLNPSGEGCPLSRLPHVCSHKAGGSVHDEGSLEGMTALLAGGIDCFDMDVITTSDDVLLVGHPGYLRHKLELDNDVSAFTHATLQQRMELAQGPKIPTLDDIVSHLQQGSAKAQLSLELKGPAINLRSLQTFVTNVHQVSRSVS
jgi:glycerophosphoryl diester phosphodiesterase